MNVEDKLVIHIRFGDYLRMNLALYRQQLIKKNHNNKKISHFINNNN
jgi:hypothetical protein